MNPIEALADGIMHHEGWTPGSHSNRNRNPGNLRPFNPSQAEDASGFRVFTSLVDGYQALLNDLYAKFKGSHGLSAQSTLLDLLSVYAPPAENNTLDYALDVAWWMSKALQRIIDPASKLSEIAPAEFPPQGKP